MKKFFLVALLGLAVSASLSAQVFVGGQIGVNTTSTTNKNVNPVATTSATLVNINPNVGYKFNDKMSVGGRLGLSFGSTNANTSTFGFGIQPYFRYTVLNFGRFGIAAEANLDISTTTQTQKTANVGVQRNNSFTFSIGALPVLLFALNEHFTLEANINVLNLNLGFGSTKATFTPEGGNAITNTDTSNFNLGIGADTNSVFANGIGAITVGFTYAF